MAKGDKITILEIDESYKSAISFEEAVELKPIQKKFMESYLENKDKELLEEWLYKELKLNLPEKPEQELQLVSKEIIDTIKSDEEKLESLEAEMERGRSKESWFAQELKKSSSHMSARESAEYLEALDDAVRSANDSLNQTIFTKGGTINQNPNLDGFIAEAHHANTFNLNAVAKGSPYRAEVLVPEGKPYGKNSVDIVIYKVEGDKKAAVRRYQSKYCKDATATEKAFSEGNYRGQVKLVPEEQSGQLSKKHSTVIESPDGVTSDPLSKIDAKNIQKDVQSGNVKYSNWNDLKFKDVAIGIGKEVGQATAMGALVGAGSHMVQKVWEGEEIQGEEVLSTALESGVDFGVKAATAGALKVGVEKGIINAFPKGTPASAIANVAHVAIENVKIFGEVAKGNLTIQEGVEKMERVTISTAAGIATSAKGTAIGAAIGAVLGPAGIAVGGLIGGAVGYMAGSKVAETITRGAQKIRSAVTKVVKKGFETVKNVAKSIVSIFEW